MDPNTSDWESELEGVIESMIEGDCTLIRERIHDRVDEILIKTTLRATRGNISQASKRLGISRPTLRLRLRQLRMEIED